MTPNQKEIRDVLLSYEGAMYDQDYHDGLVGVFEQLVTKLETLSYMLQWRKQSETPASDEQFVQYRSTLQSDFHAYPDFSHNFSPCARLNCAPKSHT